MNTQSDKRSRRHAAMVAALALTLTLAACGGMDTEEPKGGVTLPDAPTALMPGVDRIEPLIPVHRDLEPRSTAAEALEVEISIPTLGCGPYARPCDAAAGFTCVNGFCVCKPGLLRCADGCVDLNNDPDNCGGCRRACKSNQCINGTCGGGR